ncbi:MAG: hypothetical protein D8M57_07990 [Candidatus Scalindua sp. AMX11]|nr:MAG: hypothetical protein DWQ00_11590 [Candidatus Scalindua sp.]NOG85311.1 hypothetical protein [Planctomycetota bacterium]RZV81472.1 MAG: hypothetical protein EX341_10145 [Candidatus Scalindua sp. SCAELEC01]TDE65455.1 MAG: hypothetical protein D8M57_07990 [Candidatus Scalindua sp. AMX11]GJQ59379.1 MAG: hypothetical protein SCALA701_21800 [Candidatus Scalindua sp.]
MSYHPENPMIVQSDKTILLEVDHPMYEDARDDLARFAELEKSPEHIHTYRITPLSLWNTASSGVTNDTILKIFSDFSKYDVPQNIIEDIKDHIGRYGKLKLIKRNGDFLITSEDQYLITEITHNKHIIPLIKQQLNQLEFTIAPLHRGHIKQVMIKIGFPVLEKQGWIAEALCTEIRIPLAEELRMEYAVAELREKFRISSENPLKNTIIRQLLKRHDGDNVLVIGQYLSQLKTISTELNAPLITGKTSNLERERLYGEFKRGNVKILVVSKVANFAINLPDANVAIQVSGTFGSRQEEAQRLGRILRPKQGENRAHFYSLITRDTRDQDFAIKRQLFLTEQGYQYEIHDYEDVLKEKE